MKFEPKYDYVLRIKEIAFNAINNITDEVQGLNFSEHDTYQTIIFCLSLGAASIIESFEKRCSISIDEVIKNHAVSIKEIIDESRK